MTQIRRNVFETNSSSTHSIAIPKSHEHDAEKYRNRSVSFNIGEFGWSFEEENPADYLYTAIYDCYFNSEEEMNDKIQKLKDTLDKYQIHYDLGDMKLTKEIGPYDGKERVYLENGYIDHGDELREFLDAVFSSDDTLLNFIFNGLVFTGNDNCDEDEEGQAFPQRPFIYDYDFYTGKETEKPNPYYLSNADEFDWYVKGN